MKRVCQAQLKKIKIFWKMGSSFFLFHCSIGCFWGPYTWALYNKGSWSIYSFFSPYNLDICHINLCMHGFCSLQVESLSWHLHRIPLCSSLHNTATGFVHFLLTSSLDFPESGIHLYISKHCWAWDELHNALLPLLASQNCLGSPSVLHGMLRCESRMSLWWVDWPGPWLEGATFLL